MNEFFYDNLPVILILITTVLLALVLLIALPYFYNNNKKAYDKVVSAFGSTTDLVSVVLKLVDTNVGQESIVEKVVRHASSFVVIAENMPELNNPNLTKEESNVEKHEYVRNYILDTLRSENVEITENIENLVDSIIRHVVKFK